MSVFSIIKPVVQRFIIAMVQKQIENTVTKIKQGTMEEIFGGPVNFSDKPFTNNLKKNYPKADELPHNRSLNEFQKKRLEDKKKRKQERAEEVRKKKDFISVSAAETKRQFEKAGEEIAASAMNAVNTVINEAANQVLEAATLAKGMLESYKKLFTDLGTSGDKVVKNSVDLITSMVACAPAIIGTCALGPTVTPGALPLHLLAVKAKSDALGTELSKFKSALNELRGILEGLGDFSMKEEIEDTLNTVDTLTIVPQTLILATGGIICFLDIDVESMAATALEGLVGEMAGPLLALATNKASLCDNWKIKESEFPELNGLEGEDRKNKIKEYEKDFTLHTKENCNNFSPMEYQVLKDENGIPVKEGDKIVYETFADGTKVPKYEIKDGKRIYAGCENCKKYKKNEERAEKEEENKE